MTWSITTVADLTAQRAPWPASLVVDPPDPRVGGDAWPRVECGACHNTHAPEDLLDLRGAVGQALPPFLCTHCLHHTLLLRGGGWQALVAALGCLDPAVLASHAAVDSALAISRPPAGA